MWKSIFRAIISSMDTVTEVALSLGGLARSGSHRVEVIEHKSLAAAAISKMDNRLDVATRLREIQQRAAAIGPDVLEEGDAFLKAYQAERRGDDGVYTAWIEALRQVAPKAKKS